MSARELRVERLVVELGAAFQQRNVYPSGHPQVRRAIERTLAAHAELLAEASLRETTLLVVEGQLLVDREAVPDDATWSRGVLHGFERARISGLTLVAGLDDTELSAFLDGCAGPEGARSSRHLLVGRAGFTGEDPPAAEQREAPPLLRPELLDRARAGWKEGEARPAIAPLREVVAALARASAGLAPPTLPTATVEDRAFLHGLATAAGTLRLARALRVEEEKLEDLALAALLHDLGRLEPGGTGNDGESLRRHPALGAARIATLEGAPDVAVAVAFEHHFRFDARPSYPDLVEPRAPGTPTRIVAVADTWDTLRARGGIEPEDALEVLRERSGTFLDPILVDVWSRLDHRRSAPG